MPTPIRGYDGTVQTGVSGSETTFAFIESWEADIDQDVDKNGPYLNDNGKIYQARGALSLKGKLKGNVPQSKDTNQTSIITALTGGTDVRLVLTQGAGTGTKGYVVTIPAAVITGLKLGQGGKDGASFECDFVDNGGFSIA